MRIFSFHEDMRPAFVGTFSKRSAEVTGRRPFAQDFKLLNYDYDSEEEWEEVDEGEDIADSDGEEEEEGGNELEYDEFFRRDNDYGSDVDSDGEGVAAGQTQRREGEEKIGPRFLRRRAPADEAPSTDRSTTGSDRARSMRFCLESRSFVECIEKEKDVQRLRTYATATFAYPGLCPTMGAVHEPRRGDGKDGKGGDTKMAVDGVDEAAAHAPAEAKAPRVPKPPAAPRVVFDESVVPALMLHVHGKKEGIDKVVLTFHEDRQALIKVRFCLMRGLDLNSCLVCMLNLFFWFAPGFT